MPGVGRQLSVVAVVVCAVVVAATMPSAPATGRRPLPTVPPEVTKSADGWPLPGRDYANSRARSTSEITRATIDRLEPVWEAELPGGSAYGNLSTTPLIIDDTVYVQDLRSNVHAIDLDTGEHRWKTTYEAFQIGPNGVAAGYGMLYVAKDPDSIAALDRKTGEEVWSTKITRTATDGVDIQPTVVDGLVLASTVPIALEKQYAGGDRGVLWALDARTGEKVWTFDTVKSRDLWGNPEVNSGGGAWYPPAVDVERGLVYWGVANPAPFPGTSEFPNGTSRPGPNLYTESVVALDIRTGKLRWYHQAIPHDIFDRDLVHTLISGDLVVGTGKLGRVIGLDPATGDAVSDTPVGAHSNDDLTELTGPTDVLPGTFGGVLTPPSVADGVVFVGVFNSPSTHEPNRESYFGTETGVMPGQVVAVDVATGDIVWDTTIEGDPLGGTIVLGDLVLTGTFQGRIVALDRATGEIVRTIDAPGGINGWAAATDDTLVWPVGMATPPRLVAYRLED